MNIKTLRRTVAVFAVGLAAAGPAVMPVAAHAMEMQEGSVCQEYAQYSGADGFETQSACPGTGAGGGPGTSGSTGGTAGPTQPHPAPVIPKTTTTTTSAPKTAS